MIKMKKRLFMVCVVLFFMSLTVLTPNEVFAEEEISETFAQILNADGKLLVTDTSMEEDKEQFLREYLQKYAKSSYWFVVDQKIDDTHYTIAINYYNADTDEITGGEAHDVELVFEESYSEEFKSILKDGKLQVPSSTKDGINIYEISAGEYRFQIAGYDEDYTKATIKMISSMGVILEQHVVELSYLTERSEEFKKVLNKDGKLVFNSIKPRSIDEMYILSELLFMENQSYYCSCFAEDFSSMNLTINYGLKNQETHKVEIVYNYDKAVQQKLKGFVDNFPDDTEFFNVRDLELINYWVNNVEDEGSDNLDAYSGELKAAVANNNIEYYVDNRAGCDGAFYTERLGIAIFKYNGCIYHFDYMLGTKAENIIYVPDTTGNSREELIAAAQKRINEYLGKDNIVKVSYAGNAYDVWVEKEYEMLRWIWEQDDPDMTLEQFKTSAYLTPYEAFEEVLGIEGVTETDDTFLVTVKVGDKEKSFNIIIKKGSSKMVTPSYKTTDMTTNIEISSTSTSVPLDAYIQANKITSGTEYEKIIKLLDVKENAMYDLKIYSGSQGKYVSKLEDGAFEVKIPVPDNLKNKKLVAYYTDGTGKPETYEVEIKDGYAIFTTKHFSIYTLAEINSSQDNNNSETGNNTDDIDNPSTGDNVSIITMILVMAMAGLTIILKFNKIGREAD